MKTLFTSVLVFFTMLLCQAQQGSGVITGKVMEKITKVSLPGATVRLNIGNRYTISDQTGDYEFLKVPVGTYTVEVVYMGYQLQRQTVTVARGENATINFSLEDASHRMDQVEVMSDRVRGQARALNQQKNKSILPILFLPIRSDVFPMPISAKLYDVYQALPCRMIRVKPVILLFAA
ncbi:carboxypeptidase-like regulatory domain-containing protein [Sphingobacterium sp. E70]|uniref:carboxypeptidase-like regulatory domain-containing protein n=1 Tax=Sphingobacterium sp. E70 TaxID=2853439 RepID=UPI00211BB615|nr:carboxypeptidase-like regulatory domain-containing protein [Sphingobacterium sp. E70]ULT24876.1 carboxypeptidase-like regulatory domain-containing protein [Sphingobacterium sp. E70]